MIKRLLALATIGALLSGCLMVPMALVGPAVSGFSSASVMQSALTTSANLVVKKRTGKTFAQHALNAYSKGHQTIEELTTEELQQTYLPQKIDSSLEITPHQKIIK